MRQGRANVRAHTINLSDDVWVWLAASGNASNKIDELAREKMKNYGTVNSYKGKTYRLTEYATLSNRVFPGWFGDAEDGKTYTAEYQAMAVDKSGNECIVYWQFDTVKGEEPEDESNYPWDDSHVTNVVAQ